MIKERLLICVIFLLLVCPLTRMAHATKVDSMVNSLAQAEQDTSLVILLYDLAWELRGEFPDSSIRYVSEGIKLAEKLNYKRGAATSYNVLGVIYKNVGNFEKALLNYNRSLAIREKLGNKGDVSKSLNNIGTLFRHKGEYDLALEYYLKSLRIKEQLGDSVQIAKSLQNIGVFYQDQKEYDKAINYFNLSISINQRIGVESELAKAYNNLGGVFFQKGEYLKAEELYRKSLLIKEKLNDYRGQGNTWTNLGNILDERGEVEASLEAYKKSLEIRMNTGNKEGIGVTNHNIGVLYKNLGQLDLAAKYLEEVIVLAKDNGMNALQSQAAENLSVVYAELGAYQEALQYQKVFMALKDSLFNEDKAKEIGRLEATFTAQKEIDAKATEVRERTLQRNATLAGLALVCLLGFVIIWGYHQRQHAAKQLAAQKEALNAQLMVELLHDQEVENLAALMEGQEQERKRIARDLHDRLGSKLATVRLHMNGMESTLVDSESAPRFVQSTKLLDEACQEVREIAHNMASGVLTHFGLVAAIREMANTLDSSGQIKVVVHEFEMEGYRMPSSKEIGIYRVLQELISNILKHARATEVNLHLTRFDHAVNLMVEDNGIGFDPLAVPSEQAGMGLQNMKSRLSKMGGTLEIDSAIGRGTTVLMDIPVVLEPVA